MECETLDGQSIEYVALDSPDEFRLVVLEPGSSDEEIRCSLIHENLSDHGGYSAVSHRWGSPTADQQIIEVDGRHCFVPHWLVRLLVQLWVDNLCIRQDNIYVASVLAIRTDTDQASLPNCGVCTNSISILDPETP